MKRFVLIVGILIYLGFQSFSVADSKGDTSHKETTANLSSAKTVFVGWVNLSPEEWHVWGYSSKDDWTQVIKDLNVEFQKNCQSKYLSGRTVTGAKEPGDENASGNDLYVKFSDVSIDRDRYGIQLSIHFIDPKTNTELGSVPSRLYYEKRMWEFQRYLQIALDDIGKKISVEVTGTAPKK